MSTLIDPFRLWQWRQTPKPKKEERKKEKYESTDSLQKNINAVRL
jgi:hypothetical protein